MKRIVGVWLLVSGLLGVLGLYLLTLATMLGGLMTVLWYLLAGWGEDGRFLLPRFILGAVLFIVTIGLMLVPGGSQVLIGGLLGTLIGQLQARVLRPVVRPLRGWVVATAIAWALGSAVGLTLARAIWAPAIWERPLGRLPVTDDLTGTSPGLLGMLVWSAALGLAVGVGQWLVLRRHARAAALWIGANLIGGAAAWVVGLWLLFDGTTIGSAMVDNTMEGTISRLLVAGLAGIVTVQGVLGTVAGGLIYGAITGPVLIWLLRGHHRAEPAASPAGIAWGRVRRAMLRTGGVIVAGVVILVAATLAVDLIAGMATPPPPPSVTLGGHPSRVQAMAWSPDGQRLATSGWDGMGVGSGEVQTWAVTTGRAEHVLTRSLQVDNLMWSPDGQLVLGTTGNTAYVWDATTGTTRCTATTDRPAKAQMLEAAWSPDGRQLALNAGWNDGLIRIVERDTCREVLTVRGHQKGVSALAWSPDGRHLATGAWDTTVRIWDATTGQQVLVLGDHEDGWSRLAWSPDGTRLATYQFSPQVRVWEAATGRHLLTLAHPDDVTAVTWSPDGTMLAVASRGVAVWDATTGARRWSTGSPATLDVAWSPDGRHLAAGGTDLRVFAAATGHLRWREATEFSNLAWSPDGTRLATSDGRDIRLWQIGA